MLAELHKVITLRWGDAGEDCALYLVAEDVVENAQGAARNPYAKVTPETAFTPKQFATLKARIGDEAPAVAGEGVDPDEIFELASTYLNAVQREDAERQAGVLSRLRRGRPGELEGVRQVIWAIADLHSVASRTPPVPPTSD